MKNFKNLLFVALMLVSTTVLGQTKISGTVVDESNQSLPGASVLEKGTMNGTETDFDGKFSLNTTLIPEYWSFLLLDTRPLKCLFLQQNLIWVLSN